jgi:small subunit ribosomal protein S8
MHQSTSIDFLIRIKNGYRAGRQQITAPASNFCLNLANLIKKYGFLQDVNVTEKDSKKQIVLTLKYTDGQPALNDVKLFSTPGRRLYSNYKSLPWGKSQQSLIIVSTSSGVMSQKEAVTKNVGGELIAEIY